MDNIFEMYTEEVQLEKKAKSYINQLIMTELSVPLLDKDRLIGELTELLTVLYRAGIKLSTEDVAELLREELTLKNGTRTPIDISVKFKDKHGIIKLQDLSPFSDSPTYTEMCNRKSDNNLKIFMRVFNILEVKDSHVRGKLEQIKRRVGNVEETIDDLATYVIKVAYCTKTKTWEHINNTTVMEVVKELRDPKKRDAVLLPIPYKVGYKKLMEVAIKDREIIAKYPDVSKGVTTPMELF